MRGRTGEGGGPRQSPGRHQAGHTAARAAALEVQPLPSSPITVLTGGRGLREGARPDINQARAGSTTAERAHGCRGHLPSEAPAQPCSQTCPRLPLTGSSSEQLSPGPPLHGQGRPRRLRVGTAAGDDLGERFPGTRLVPVPKSTLLRGSHVASPEPQWRIHIPGAPDGLNRPGPGNRP